MNRWQRCQKRAFDILLSLAGLLVLWPVILVTWGLALRDTGASGLFVQERIGLHGRPFRLVKLRTMRPVGGSTVTTRDDARVTWLGRKLRKWKLDELPQLWNVLKGEMSLVGPRPTVAEDYARMTQRQAQRDTTPPGITGLAQINGNTALSWPQRIEYDLRYIETWSLLLDVRILFGTARLAVSGRIETHPASEDEWVEGK